MRLALIALLLAGCGNPYKHMVMVDKSPDFPGGWRTKGVILRTVERGTRLEFHKHVFLVTNLGDGYRGYIHPEQVQLRGAEFEIRATEEYFEIGWRKRPPERWKMSELPTDKLIVFDGTSVVYEDLPQKPSTEAG